MAEAGPSECEKQKTVIGNLLKTSLKKGDTWYLIDTKWYKQWKKYVGYDSWDTSFIGDQSAYPGPIDNSSLFKEGSVEVLKENLIDELEYVLVPEEAWTKLLDWYNISEGQSALSRPVIEYGIFNRELRAEIYPVELEFHLHRGANGVDDGDDDATTTATTTPANPDNNTTKADGDNDDDDDNNTEQQRPRKIRMGFSRTKTIEDIEKEMRRLYEIDDSKQVRLWNKYMSNTYEQLSKPENTVQDAGLYQNQVIVIEEQNEDGTWPRQSKNTENAINTYNSQRNTDSSTSTTSNRLNHNNYGSGGSSSIGGGSGSNKYYYNSDGYSDSYSRGSSSTPGLCGLSNLGNTCFMNSAIQCMSNVPELTEYFQTADWQGELNVDNPLGMRGEIATSYAELIRNMWSGNYSYTVPRNFKVAVGHFAPQFSGYQQQDSQELMAFLLDGLHEDLNRIKKKPYIEQKDEEGRSDEIVASEAWSNYRKRNDSIIVDIFHGQLKSTLVCPDCDKVSVTFDPICYLSLPLPDKKERQIEVFFVPNQPTKKPKHYKLTVPQRGNVNHLCKALSKLNGVPHELMVVTDVYNRRFHKVFPPDEPLSHILDRDDIFIYEVPVKPDDKETIVLPVYMREKKVSSSYNGYQRVSQQLFGQPLLVPVPKQDCTYDTLYNCVLDKMVRYVKVPEDNEEWWKSSSKKSSFGDGGEPMTNGGSGEMECDEESNNKSSTTATASSSSSSSSSASSSMDNNGTGNNGLSNGTDADTDTGAAGSSAAASGSAAASAGKENDEEEEDEDENGGEMDEAGNRRPPRLFTFQLVNSFGTTEMDKLPDDGKALKFSTRSYIAIDWHPRAKTRFYDEKAAEELEVDDTVNQRNGGPAKKQTIQLTECLELFTTTEKLGEQDPWYCPNCKKHQRATKKFDLWQLPRVLVIHLKRFSYNRYWRDKLDTFIEFPTKGLDMRKWVINQNHGPALYDLVAVCNHYGGMGGGHYTAYGKNKEEGTWHYFDDSSVSTAQEDSAVTKAGYVLVYRMQDAPPLNYSLPTSSAAAAASTTTTAPAAAAATAATANPSSATTGSGGSKQKNNSASGSAPSTTITTPPQNSSNNSSDDEMDIN